jgi:hypothetical protein
MDSLFPAELRGLTSSPAPVLFRVRVHPLVRLTSSTEYLLIHTRPRSSRTSSTFLGVSFPIATSVTRVHHSVSSHAHLRSALSVSRALDGLLLCLPCGLISSHCHVRDSLLRGLPRCQADPTHRRAVPSCRLPTFASSRVAPTVQLRPARLQGFDPGSDPLRPAECLVLPTARSPLEFSLLRAFFRSPWRRLRASSAPALGRQNLHVTPVTGLQRIDG